MQTLTIKRMHEKRLQEGHLWVFSNELKEVPTDIPAGAVVEVETARGDSFGLGMYNPHSLIAVRLLQVKKGEVDVDFFRKRIAQARNYRERLLPGANSYRLVFGESDFLPGLVVDKYEDYFAIQTLSAGMDIRKEMIVQALREEFPNCKGVVEKNRSQLRLHEGLQESEGVLWGDIPDEIIMTENGIKSAISLTEGQKTGYFLDQKINRKAVMDIAKGLRVLDCFTNQGGFALHAAAGGAKHVVGLDSSAKAIAASQRNAQINNLQNVEFLDEEVFRSLDRRMERSEEWDCVILDPPSFTKSKKEVPDARRGYARINRTALCLIPSGGFLVTASCSHHIFEDVFLEIITEQAKEERRQLKLVFRGSQSPDHPVLLSMPQTRYLKFFIFEVQ